MAFTSIFESSDGEQRWINQVSKILQHHEVMVQIDLPVSIFRVPATISAFKPEAYVPQLIGLGPYHHFRSELYEMERYKLAAAARHQSQFKSLEFKQLVNQLIEHEHRVRACYHMYLDVEGETLAWIMAIDGLFLLDFLHNYHIHMKENSVSSSATTAHLVDSTGRKLAHGTVLGDIMMLENQIPIFLLREIVSIQCSLPDVEDNLLPSMLMGFCKSLSPIKLIKEDLPSSQVTKHAHLLDLLYHLIVPKMNCSEDNPGNGFGKLGSSSFDTTEPSFDSSKSYQVFDKLWNLLCSLHVGLISTITKPIQNLLGVSSKIISNVPGVSILMSKKKEDIKPEEEVSSDVKKTPKVEEIMIPSVSMLRFAGVEFCPTTGGISTIQFDACAKKFYLPVITLNVNSEVVMRNLVAYESSLTSESLVFTRYTELMNGIIDTVEDAKLLRENKIIVNSLKSDADVAELFNGMSKSVRLTNVPYIDKAIEDVNKCFNNTKQIRMYRRMKNFVYGSWQILTIIAVVLLMLLMALQSFCSVYSCPRMFHTFSSSTSASG
ncbi:putative UPF0481 protein At3g02645 [Camellia sinensis]|uniref:Uncharacterized protein n=1 Tax=Camellia sinensis var. sinensis TaxID=542762 RepID=A0A4S4EQ54_CAMSN|nr:putative UPF0481 protein At3g02645 [Camellia sinensis]THG18879.1 hypothetical protein TEA_009724 [Camellia sinensis var. sinensis]